MRRVFCFVAYLMLGCSVTAGAAAEGLIDGHLNWTQLPPLQDALFEGQQGGFWGAFAGVHNDALIIAGGTSVQIARGQNIDENFWSDDIFVLQKTGDDAYQWLSDKTFKLPRPLAYGVTISTSDGIICIGGCDDQQCYRDVLLLKWNREIKKIEIETLPGLPSPLAFMAGARIGNIIYIAGGQGAVGDAPAANTFWALDLSKKNSEAAFDWQQLPAWPGKGRIFATAASQSDGTDDCFYLFGGINSAPGAEKELLTDAYSYNPRTHQWKRLADVSAEEENKHYIAGGALACGANHILIFAHKELRGISTDVLAYHTITDSWAKFGQVPAAEGMVVAALKWRDSFIIPSLDVRGGVGKLRVLAAEAPSVQRFGTVNFVVLGVYFLVLVCMGVYFSRREKTTDDFFKAGQRIPWWAAGLSIFGTQLSAITFMAIPAKSFATDWRYLMLNITTVAVAPLIIMAFLPFYRRLNVTTAYEYLERRFNLAARLIGSLMFVVFQFGRIGIVLFLPSIALSIVTGIDIRLCIILMGVLSIAYTVMGGIEAVIWTDVLQVIVLLSGALLALVIVLLRVEGGFAGMVEAANLDNKFHTFDFRFDLTVPTFWVVVLGGIAVNLISYGTDQTVIQRYLTTKDEKSAARSIWTNAVFVIPGSFLFFGIGTALFVFYKSNPQLMSPTLNNADAIFPWYIVTQLPQGVAGLLIGAVFAAAMSSLDSSMNSVATALTTDFYRRFKPDVSDHNCLRVARWLTVIIGVTGIALALMMTAWDIKSLWDEFSKVIGLFTGGLGGLFLLGIFCRRAHGVGAVVGLVVSGIIQYLVKQYTPISFLLYTFTGLASCLIIGYVASIMIRVKEKPIEGLTIYTIRQRE